jgi:hypothetical protein
VQIYVDNHPDHIKLHVQIIQCHEIDVNGSDIVNAAAFHRTLVAFQNHFNRIGMYLIV